MREDGDEVASGEATSGGPDELRPDRVSQGMATFRAWHREPSLWREIYTRTASALIAAFVIYRIAAFSGLVSRRPQIGIFGTLFGLSLLWLITLSFKIQPVQKELWPLFKTWNTSTEPKHVRAKELYNPLVFAILAVLASGLFLFVSIFVRP